MPAFLTAGTSSFKAHLAFSKATSLLTQLPFNEEIALTRTAGISESASPSNSGSTALRISAGSVSREFNKLSAVDE
jgi:hypothetical protein